MSTIASHVDTIIDGTPFKFSRQREGMKVFTRAQFFHGGDWRSCDVVWDVVNPPRGELLIAMHFAIDAKDIVLRQRHGTRTA